MRRVVSYDTKLTTVIKELKSKGNFGTMTISQDEDEHSLEMHLPYIYTILAKLNHLIALLTLEISIRYPASYLLWLVQRTHLKRENMVVSWPLTLRTKRISSLFQVISVIGTSASYTTNSGVLDSSILITIKRIAV